MMAQEKQFLKSQVQFEALCELVQQAGRDGLRMDEIERQLMPGLMLLGRRFLEGHTSKLKATAMSEPTRAVMTELYSVHRNPTRDGTCRSLAN